MGGPGSGRKKGSKNKNSSKDTIQKAFYHPPKSVTRIKERKYKNTFPGKQKLKKGFVYDEFGNPMRDKSIPYKVNLGRK